MIGGNRLNPKIEKLAKDIQKTENKIAELQDKLADLKKQKTELENLDYGEVARALISHRKSWRNFEAAETRRGPSKQRRSAEQNTGGTP